MTNENIRKEIEPTQENNKIVADVLRDEIKRSLEKKSLKNLLVGLDIEVCT